jgi:hypothetical protein
MAHLTPFNKNLPENNRGMWIQRNGFNKILPIYCNLAYIVMITFLDIFNIYVDIYVNDIIN